MGMKTTNDTDKVLFDVLKASAELTGSITGDIFMTGDRPDNSEKEDIVINTITLSQDSEPQKGTSNINIYVPDMDVKIGGLSQKKANRKRLQALTALVLTALRSANIQGLRFWPTNQNNIKEPALSQHFSNIRIDWNIHITN